MRRRRVAGVGLGHGDDGTFFAPTPEETDMRAAKSPPTTIAAVKDVVPKLAELTEKVLFGDVWANGISAAQVAKQVYEERGA
jgi:alkylhydroperoxidase/carboxymuconolactone decarboxylase family protein YurZ